MLRSLQASGAAAPPPGRCEFRSFQLLAGAGAGGQHLAVPVAVQQALVFICVSLTTREVGHL